MDRPEALLHVVGSEQVGDAGELVEEVVFGTEHRSRSHNGRLGVDGTNNILSPCLCDWNQYIMWYFFFR